MRTVMKSKAASVPISIRGRSPLLQRKCACGNSAGLTGTCSDCQKKEMTLQRRSTTQNEVSEVPPIVHEVLRSPGQPLDPETRTFMESRFRHDFNEVRVHTDEMAAQSAQAVNAIAYTNNHHIVFANHRYNPQTTDGQELLAHELTHVIQQQHSFPSAELELGSVDHALEREANLAEKALTQSSAPLAIGHTGGTSLVMRQPAEQLRPAPTRPVPPRPAPSLRVIEGGLSRATARSAERAGWRFFWRAVTRRFALRGAIAAALAAADGPLPIGDLIGLGLALWMIWDIVQLWDIIWSEASQLQNQSSLETQPQAQTQPQTERDRRRSCHETNPTFLSCEDEIDKEEILVDFLMREGYSFDDLYDCQGIDSFSSGAIDACDGAPGERWHCRSGGGVISIFGCLCCRADGTVGYEWRRPHWSTNLSRRGGSGRR